MLTGRRLAWSLVFAGVIAVSTGVSCRGFFSNTLTAIAIQPPTPNIEIGAANTQTIVAYGTYSDNSRSAITSGVAWTSSDNSVVEILAPCATQACGSAIVQGVGNGTATLTAAAQGLSATATATAYLGSVTGFQVCMGTFGATTSCSSGGTPLTWNANVTTTQITQNFIAQGTSSGTLYDLTTASTFTVSSTPTAGSITCDNSATPAVCTVEQGTTAGTYTIVVTYGTNSSATISVVVTG